MRYLLRSKIHRATVTTAHIDYIGSITVDQDLMEAAGLWEGEKVLLASVSSGNRLETYIIPGNRGSGEICVNGAAAHHIKPGELIIIMGFEITDEPITPKVVHVDKDNKIVD